MSQSSNRNAPLYIPIGATVEKAVPLSPNVFIDYDGSRPLSPLLEPCKEPILAHNNDLNFISG
jgi:hypothetical protein